MLVTQPFQSKEHFGQKMSSHSKRMMSSFSNITWREWNDWRWQLRNRFKKLEQIEGFLNLTSDERLAIEKKQGLLSVAITPYYASLIQDKVKDPLRKTVLPLGQEAIHSFGETPDPLGEEPHRPVPGVVHRYPDRIIFLVTGFCSVYCRYCTRSRLVGDNGEYRVNPKEWEKAFEYIENHKEIRDVLISGGDPLTLSDDRIEYLLKRLRSIPHVEFIRIGTKVPFVLPQRITPSLCRVLKKYHPVWMSVHVLHPNEVTLESKIACERLANAGVPLGSQTVLLKGVNDQAEVLKKLFHSLLKIRVKPYYLFHCDPISGSAHFRTSVQKGIELIQSLRGHTSGYAIPHYAIDIAGSGGKVALSPEYIQGRDGDYLIVKNYKGEIYNYPDAAGSAVLEIKGDKDASPKII